MFKTTLKIDGMACNMCEAHVNDAIRKSVPGARKVRSSHSKKISTFITDTETDLSEVRAAIDATGYTYISGSTEPYEKKGLFGFLKS